MTQQFTQLSNDLDSDGNPAGGQVNATGLSIFWQRGPLGRGEDRKEPNGCFVETVLEAAKQRIEFYQSASEGKFACQENDDALLHIREAIAILNKRTERREKAENEGTHKGN